MKLPPGKYRTYGYEPPSRLMGEIHSGIRAFNLCLGNTPNNFSPEAQKGFDLNKDIIFFPKDMMEKSSVTNDFRL